jgi:hypothetical protein
VARRVGRARHDFSQIHHLFAKRQCAPRDGADLEEVFDDLHRPPRLALHVHADPLRGQVALAVVRDRFQSEEDRRERLA